jgi:hypothetical protein
MICLGQKLNAKFMNVRPTNASTAKLDSVLLVRRCMWNTLIQEVAMVWKIYASPALRAI